MLRLFLNGVLIWILLSIVLGLLVGEIIKRTQTDHGSNMTRPIKRFNAGKEARRRARQFVGPLPVSKVIPDKRDKPEKHKKKDDASIQNHIQ